MFLHRYHSFFYINIIHINGYNKKIEVEIAVDTDNMTVETVETVEPIVLDIFNLREKRQNDNKQLALKSLKSRNFTKNVNVDEYNRVLMELKEVDKTEKDLLEECDKSISLLTILTGRIAINASRQGSKDEKQQIYTVNETTSKFGISLMNLSATAYRPTKSGEILDKKEIKTRKIQKNDCLKSFDAKIEGKIKGWVFAKVVIGNGGHQDNVFEEAHTFCDWVVKFGETSELYILLIDTNLTGIFDDLKNKYEQFPHLLIGNHVQVQQYFIDNYSKSCKI